MHPLANDALLATNNSFRKDVVVEHMEFAESKGTSAPDDAAFIDIPEEMIAEMPFR